MSESKSSSQLIREAICRRIQDLPPLPHVVGELLTELSNEETTTAARLESLILRDPALAAKTLRVVNSAYYGLSRKVLNIGQAVVILGTAQLRSLLMSLAAVSILQSRTPRLRAIQKRFWEHSLASAICAELVCQKKQLPPKEIEVAFVGGLLHEIGRLFLFTNLPDTYQKIVDYASKHGVRLSEAEEQVLGISHDEIGVQLSRNWRFPDALEAFIGRHEGPFDELSPTSLLAVHAAHIHVGPLFDQPVEEGAMDPVAEDWLRFEEFDWMALRADTVRRMDGQYEMLTGMAA